MSLPKFPDRENQPTRDEALNQVISSIAMEEVGLSHIINAEGEKIQYVLGTLPNVPPLATAPTIDDLLAINQSVRDTLDTTVQNQMFLRGKLQSALNAATLIGPTGATGPSGPPLDPDTTILTVDDGTNTQELKFQNTLEFQSETLDITVEDGPVVKIEMPRSGGSFQSFWYPNYIVISTATGGGSGQGLALLPTNVIEVDFTNSTVIDLSNEERLPAITVPKDGILTSISAHFTVTYGGADGFHANVNAAVFRSTNHDFIFTQVSESLLTLSFEGEISERTVNFGAKDINIPLNQNDLIFVGIWLTSETSNTLRVFPTLSIGVALD